MSMNIGPEKNTGDAELFFCGLVTDAAERFLGNSEVRSDDMLWKALDEFRILLGEIGIAFFGGQTNGSVQSFLRSDGMILI